MSHKLPSTYRRKFQDTPIRCKQTFLHANVYKYGCENPDCECKVFKMCIRDRTYFDSENLDAVVSNSENAVYIRFKNDLLFAPDNAYLTDADVYKRQVYG